MEVRGILSDLQGKLAKVFQELAKCNRHLSASKWVRYGDTYSKAFFDFHHIGKKRTLLRELETKIGTITSQNDLSLYITDFYTNLYSSDALALGIKEAQSECWSSVPIKVT